jgi:hypothetical protein
MNAGYVEFGSVGRGLFEHIVLAFACMQTIENKGAGEVNIQTQVGRYEHTE